MYSPRINLDIMTVKMGAELFTVSAKDTATFFRLTKPRTTVVNLTNPGKYDVDTRIAKSGCTTKNLRRGLEVYNT